MQVQQVLRIEEYGADDVGAVETGRRILDAARAVDSPFLPPMTLFRRTMYVRHGWDGTPVHHMLCHVDDRPVAVVELEFGEWDNRDLAWSKVVVDPAERRRGHGSQIIAEVLELARAHGCTKFGADAWETPAADGFAQRHGFARASEAIYRVLEPERLPTGLVAGALREATAYAGDYVLSRHAGPAPESLLPELSELTAVINDAPLDDLDVEDEVFPVERIRAYENAVLASGRRLYRIVARHRATGQPAGHTVVVVDVDDPAQAHQHDTAVVREHRGHRLGLLLKADMITWLGEVEPQISTIATFNAESNVHMVAVNERLGYRALGRELEFQLTS